MPDFKYAENELGERFSKIKNYFEITSKAILEMYNQVGKMEFDNNGILKKGVVIRHLVLPNHIENSKKVLNWIKQNMPSDVYISVMAQYFPTYKAKEIKELGRKLTQREIKKIEDYVYYLGFENGYIQNLGENEGEYVPKWDM